MADSGDLSIEAIARKIAGQYAVLQISCEMLPVPIALPEASVTLSNLDTIPAVQRVVDLAEEQPMPEEVQAHLFTAAIFWLTAMDLLGIIVANEWTDARAYQALGALSISGDALKDLGTWLVDQQ
ncbi:hypothetical protein OHB41_21030 [Streptomyces sp. NBC_01571]|uniref:hypothetical protein n=1 Tax=Streptomyces sp. NBC_01571 TaxID=2975883 RepID=UPI002259D794|nr:hypothetical protein [Streptomyces sp. NBC_01571]MCX4575628.1 hypothetical protein [Streptomyces sp. NBC_01571]